MSDIQTTMTAISDAMNAQVLEWKDKGAVRFGDVPTGARFVWAAMPADSPDTMPKTRTKGGYRIDGFVRVFRTGAKVLVYILH